MTNRRALLVGAVGLVAAPFLVEAQPAGKVARVGVLDVGSAADSARQIASLSKALRELGHIEGQNITIEWRFAETQVSRLSNLAMELIALKPDVLVSRDVHGIRVLRNATTTIPIVMAGSDYQGTSRLFAETLARPGGNITGLLSLGPELEGKRIELLRDAVPSVSRVATFWDTGYFSYRAGRALRRGPKGGESPLFRSPWEAPMSSTARSPRSRRRVRPPCRSRTRHSSTSTVSELRP